jgi:hypothetical protein
MSGSMNYAKAIQKEKKIVVQEKDVLFMHFKDGNVVYSINKSEELLQNEQNEAEKQEDLLRVQMNKAVREIEARRSEYRRKCVEDYGHDYYTKDFNYTCPESSDEEEV